MTENAYIKSLLSARAITDFNMAKGEEAINSALRKAYRDLSRLLELSKPGTLTHAVYATHKKAIEKLITDMSISIKNNINYRIDKNVRDIVRGEIKNTKEYIKGSGYSVDLEGVFGQVPQRAFANIVNRSYNGVKLSGRLWRMDKYAKSGIQDLINAGVARGQSGVEMAKELRRFLVDPSITPGTSWTTKVRKSVHGKGTLNYNAVRVVKTEVNNSYREAHVLSAVKNPLIKGVKWNLSTRHEVTDICDVWSESNSYGMGTGVFHPAGVPIDHPMGDCYLTDVLRKPADWRKPKTLLSKTRRVSKDTVTKMLTPKGMSEKAIARTYKQYVETDKMINKSVAAIQK